MISPLLERTLWNGCFFFTGCCCREEDGLVWVGGASGSGRTGEGLLQSDGSVTTYQFSDPTSTTKIRIGPNGDVWSIGGGQINRRRDDTFSLWSQGAAAFGGLAVDADGNAYCIVSTKLRKYDPDGATLLEFDHGCQVPSSISVDLEGNIIVLDTEFTVMGGRGIVKFDASGTELWQVDRDGNAGEAAVDADGNIYVAKGLLRKYDPDGGLLWTASEPTDVGCARVCVDDQGDPYVQTIPGDAPNSVAKYRRTDGALIWEAHPITSSAADGILLVGALAIVGTDLFSVNQYLAGTGGEFPVAHRLDAGDGTIVWSKVLDRSLFACAVAPGVAPLFQ